MTRAFIVALPLLGGIAWAGAGAPRSESEDVLHRTKLELRIAAAVLQAYEESVGPLPSTGDKPVTLDSLRKTLGLAYGRRLPSKDGWGNPLRFWKGENFQVLLSDGADGRPDEALGSEVRNVQVWVDDVVLWNGEFHDPDTDRKRGTMADIRAVGTAIESYAVDNDVYPGPTSGLVPLSVLSEALEPIYIKSLPTQDAWGNPYLCWSRPDGYVIVSLGSDRQAEVEYAPSPEGGWPEGRGATSGPEADIVFVNGQFVQWPETGNGRE